MGMEGVCEEIEQSRDNVYFVQARIKNQNMIEFFGGSSNIRYYINQVFIEE